MASPVVRWQIAPVNSALSTSPTWIDITRYVTGWTINGGFASELDTIAEARTAEVRLVVTGANVRLFDPTYASNISPGNLIPGKQIRCQVDWAGTTYDRFRGHVEGWPQTYVKGDEVCFVTLRCVDGKQYLANIPIKNDTVLSLPGAVHRFGRKKRKSHRHREGAPFEPNADLSQYSDLIQYSKPWAYWPAAGDDAAETVTNEAGGNDLIPKNGATLGLSQLVTGDEYPSNVMSFTRANSTYFKTTGLECPQFSAVSVECIFALTTLPSFHGGIFRLVSGPDDSGGLVPIFSLYLNATDDVVGSVRLTNNTNYTWTIAATLTTNTVYHAAMVYDAAGGTIGAYLNGVGSSSATGAGALRLDDPGATNNDIFVGGAPQDAVTGYCNCSINHVAIYNRVITATTFLAHYNAIPLGFLSGLSASVRVGDVLDAVGWPSAWRDLNSGTYQTLVGRRYANQSAMDELETTMTAEFGRLWLDPAGNVTLYNRDWRSHADFSSSAATFGDAAGEMPYYGIGDLTRDDGSKITRVTVKALVSDNVSVNEDAAIDPPVALDLGEVILDNKASADTLASNLVTRYKTPATKIEELVIRPLRSPDVLWPKVLGYDLCKQITIKRRPLGPGDTAISQASHIEQVKEEVSMSGGGINGWETTWSVSPR